jgi:hypothetical protein
MQLCGGKGKSRISCVEAVEYSEPSTASWIWKGAEIFLFMARVLYLHSLDITTIELRIFPTHFGGF